MNTMFLIRIWLKKLRPNVDNEGGEEVGKAWFWSIYQLKRHLCVWSGGLGKQVKSDRMLVRLSVSELKTIYDLASDTKFLYCITRWLLASWLGSLLASLRAVIISPADFVNMLPVTVRARAGAFVQRDACDRIVISIFLDQGERRVCAFAFLTQGVWS